MEKYVNGDGSRIFRNAFCRDCEMCSCDDWYCHNCNAEFIENGNGEFMRADNGADAVRVYDHERTCIYYMCRRALECSGRVHYCTDCDEYHADAVYNSSTDEHVSYNYAYENLYYCDECGDWYESYDFNHNCGMCTTCAENMPIIKSWHDHKHDFTPVYAQRDSDDEKRKTIGFELEIDSDDAWSEYNEETARGIEARYISHFVYEYDCSLNRGFEIITQPHSYNAICDLDIEALTNYLKGREYVSHDTDTCGLHLHFSVNWLGDDDETRRETLYNVIMFYEHNFNAMYKLSRRDDYEDYADMNSRANEFDIYGDDMDNIIDANIHGSRYVAVNCRGFYRGGDESTIEFRLGRGTLNANTLRAWIDIHKAIIEYCRVSDAHDFNEMCGYCTQRAIDYMTCKHVI